MNHAGTRRRYTHLNRSWYGQAARERDVVDKVTFGLHHADGGGMLLTKKVALFQLSVSNRRSRKPSVAPVHP